MFDVEAYYNKAWSGTSCHDESIVPYIKSFAHIILWGASYQGKAIGKKLLELGVNIENYWDIRWKEIGSVNGIEVIHPFESNNFEDCLVIICIGNRVIQQNLIAEMIRHSFKNILHGDYLYMGLLCPFNRSTGISAKRCTQTMECRQIYCKRIEGIYSGCLKSDESISLPSITLVINQRCSLKCKYCTSYMNEYSNDQKIDFSLEQICRDIDVFFDLVDFVGTITVMGGEPFMHKELGEIVAYLCTKKNFGLISIATSGTYPITENQLNGLRDPRVNISFSNYTESISETQKRMFASNVEAVKQSGVCYTVGMFSPEWIVPVTLENKNLSDDQARMKKSICTHWHQLKNGKVHPCDLANSIYSLEIADYPDSYFDLTQDLNRSEMKEALKKYLEKDFYEVCRHHDRPQNGKLMTAKAAEQGYMDFKKPLEEP